MKKQIIIEGATSSLAKELIIQFAKNGFDLVLCAKNTDEVKKIASDVKVRYGSDVKTYACDASDLESHDKLLSNIKRECKNVYGIVLAHGYMPPNDADTDLDEIRKIVQINYSGVISLTKAFTKYFDKKGNFIAVVTSVAGERGKSRNLIYNSAKGAASIYLEGLRQRHRNLSVIDIRPGFVDTPMTYGTVNSFLTSSREKAAKTIYKGITKRKKVIYAPGFWKYIMLTLRFTPGFIYDRLKL